MLRLALQIVLMLAAGWATLASRAEAASDTIDLDGLGCAFYAPVGADPRIVIDRTPPDCDKARQQPQGRVSYVRFTGFALRAQPGDPLEFSHRLARADFERVFFGYADGTILRSPTERDKAARPFAPNEVYFEVPYRASPLTTILVEAKGFENRFGLATRARVAPRSQNLDPARTSHFAYGLFAGAIVAMVLYNLMLYRAMRFRFILFYALLGTTMLGFGLTWSSGIQLLWPAISINTQVALNFLFYAMLIAALPGFVASFLEAKATSRWLRRVTTQVGLVAVAASLARLLALPIPWEWLDWLTYVGIFTTIALLAVQIVLAFVRRSRAVYYLVLAWALPLAFAAYRTLWAMGYVRLDGLVMDIGPLAIMAIALVLSAVGLAVRIETLKTERDDAQAMRAMLAHLADTDPLTGLLTRRAFLEKVHELTGTQRLILFDIDGLRRINDRFGHEPGDWVLVEVARLLKADAPAGVLLGRIGGEEFALVGAEEALARISGDAIADRIGQAPMPIPTRVSLNWGEATGACSSSEAWRDLYSRANGDLADRFDRSRAA